MGQAFPPSMGARRRRSPFRETAGSVRSGRATVSGSRRNAAHRAKGKIGARVSETAGQPSGLQTSEGREGNRRQVEERCIKRPATRMHLEATADCQRVLLPVAHGETLPPELSVLLRVAADVLDESPDCSLEVRDKLATSRLGILAGTRLENAAMLPASKINRADLGQVQSQIWLHLPPQS